MKIVKDSGQIEVVSPYGKVYLYTHENAHSLIQSVHDVLSKGVRWDDPDYLSRMLFCKMIPEDEKDGEKGYGIGTQMYIDVNILVTIDTVKKHIKIYSAENKLHHYDTTFENFVNEYSKNASL